jgi:hypothetical protein
MYRVMSCQVLCLRLNAGHSHAGYRIASEEPGVASGMAPLVDEVPAGKNRSYQSRPREVGCDSPVYLYRPLVNSSGHRRSAPGIGSLLVENGLL